MSNYCINLLQEYPINEESAFFRDVLNDIQDVTKVPMFNSKHSRRGQLRIVKKSGIDFLNLEHSDEKHWEKRKYSGRNRLLKNVDEKNEFDDK